MTEVLTEELLVMGVADALRVPQAADGLHLVAEARRRYYREAVCEGADY